MEADDETAAGAAKAWIQTLAARSHQVVPGEFRTSRFQSFLPGLAGRFFALAGQWLAALLLRRRRMENAPPFRNVFLWGAFKKGQ